MICPNGRVLKRPTDAEAGVCLGITPSSSRRGLRRRGGRRRARPASPTAVYAASEGLSVIVLDERAFGGQAGASARIENYLGFPTGISGHGPGRPRLHPGHEIRRRARYPAHGGAARMRRRRTASAAIRFSSSSPTAAPCAREPWWSPRAPATAGRRFRTSPSSRARASPLGLAGRGEVMRGRSGGRGRWRQLGWPGGRLSRRQGQTSSSRGARRRARGDDVALSHRSHRGPVECRLHARTEITALAGDPRRSRRRDVSSP